LSAVGIETLTFLQVWRDPQWTAVIDVKGLWIGNPRACVPHHCTLGWFAEGVGLLQQLVWIV